MSTFLIRLYQPNGAHRQVAVFVGPDADHLALAGRLTFLDNEAQEFIAALVLAGSPLHVEEVPA